MRVIPVIDLMRGVVVRGVGGRRGEYRAVESRLAAAPRPLDVARALRAAYGFQELYVADLDALGGERPRLDIVSQLAAEGWQLWVDAGIREEAAAAALLAAGATRVIVAVETLPDPDLLSRIVDRCGASRVSLGLDLKMGRLLGHAAEWRGAGPIDVAADAIDRGVRSLVVLDLAAVGEKSGVVTRALCAELRGMFPHVELVTGGGVRGPTDLRELAAVGVDGALVASALHDGALSPRDVAGFA